MKTLNSNEKFFKKNSMTKTVLETGQDKNMVFFIIQKTTTPHI